MTGQKEGDAVCFSAENAPDFIYHTDQIEW